MNQESILEEILLTNSLSILDNINNNFLRDIEFLKKCFKLGELDKFASTYFLNLDNDIKSNWDFIKYILTLNLENIDIVYENIPNSILENNDYLLELIQNPDLYHFHSKYIPDKYKNNLLLINNLINNFKDYPNRITLHYFKYFGYDIRNNREFVMKYINSHKTCEQIYEYCGEDIKNNINLTTLLLELYNPNDIYPFSCYDIQNSIDIMDKLIDKGYINLFRFSSKKVKSNIDFIKKFFNKVYKENTIPYNFQYCDDMIKNNTKFILWLFKKKYIKFFEYTSIEIKSNLKLIIHICKDIDDITELDYIYQHCLVKYDIKLAKWLITKGAKYIYFNTSDDIKNSDDFLIWLVKNDYSNIAINSWKVSNKYSQSL